MYGRCGEPEGTCICGRQTRAWYNSSDEHVSDTYSKGSCSSVGRVPVRVLAICLGEAMSNSRSTTLELADLNGEPLISICYPEHRER